MLGTLWSLLGLAVTVGGGILGYSFAKTFTLNKLRYVDAIHKAIAPIGAGLAAALGVALFTFLPLISTMTALVVGASVALGVSAGARDIRKRIGA